MKINLNTLKKDKILFEDLLKNKNFRNTQNYILGDKEKNDKIIYFLGYNNVKSLGDVVLRLPSIFILFLYKLRLGIRLSIIIYLALGLPIFYKLFSYSFSITDTEIQGNLVFFILIFFVYYISEPFRYRGFKNYNVLKVNSKNEWTAVHLFDKFSKYKIGISRTSVVYNKKKLNKIKYYKI